MIYRILALCVVAAGLAGCARGISAQQFDDVQAAMRQSPALRRAIKSECAVKLSQAPYEKRASWAAIMHTTPAASPRLFCIRVLRAVVAGRISYADYTAALRGNFSPQLIRVVQNR